MCRGLAQLLSCEQVNSEEAQWLAKQVGSRLPPGWGATWTERGCSELEGTPIDQRQLLVSYMRAMEVRCVEYDTREHADSVISGGVHSVNRTRRCATCAEFH